MKRWSVICLVGALAVIRNACGLGIAIDRVEPSSPWDGTVKIDYTVSAAEGAGMLFASVSFSLADAAGGPPVAVKTFFSKPLATVGRHSVLWDADADGVTLGLQSAAIKAKLSVPYNYMVIDVSGGSVSEEFQVSYLLTPPAGGFKADEYMGDKIVLRRIPAGTYVSGPRTDDMQVSLPAEKGERTMPACYMGIFEITQKQYAKVTGSTDACANPGDFYPRDRVSYEDVCGVGRVPDDPVKNNSFAGVMNAKCRAADEGGNWIVPVEGFDLPTEWQWEYACRAGTTTPYNSGSVLEKNADAYIADLLPLGRFNKNVDDGKGGSYSKTTTVGSYAPNAWGLYDMHGNAWEWCRDSYNGNSYRITRGGCYGHTYDFCTSYARSYDSPSYRSDYGGFRLCVPVPREVQSAEFMSAPVAVAFDCSASQRTQAKPTVVKLDSRSGVRVVMQRSDIFPFAFSQTNFTGIASADAQSVATISVIQLSGEGEDVSEWTQEIDGTRQVLMSDRGEGTVKWSPKRGVWRAEFAIRNEDAILHEESALFDLRHLAQGIVIFFQ